MAWAVAAFCEGSDLIPQIARATVRVALHRLLAEESEPAFHLAQPPRVRRRAVQMVARPFGQPSLHHGVLLPSVVVQ